MDPELEAALLEMPDMPFWPVADAREALEKVIAGAPAADTTGVVLQGRLVPGPVGAPQIRVEIIRPEDAHSALPAVLDIHGGGFAIGSPKLDEGLNIAIARDVEAVVVSVDYRLAPENPYPAPVEDCYAALVWLSTNAAELGVDPARIAVLGDSGGGGLAAATVLLARDRGGPTVAMQILLEPELDDRLQTESMKRGTQTPVWRYEKAVQSWDYYLQGQEASPYAAPARMADLSGLPPTYVTVNELDPLRDEGLDYAYRLLRAGVSTELHCWPGAYHGFNLVAGAKITERANQALIDALNRGLTNSA